MIMPKKAQLKPRKIPAQERSRSTVMAIYQAATQIFSKEGYEGTTTDLIAERAGVSIGTLYQYFPSKDAILLGLFEQHIHESKVVAENFLDEVRRRGCIAPDMTPRIIRMILEYNLHDHAQHMRLIGNVGWPEDIVRLQMDLSRFLRKMIEEIFETSTDVHLKDPKTAAHIVWSSARLIIHDYLLYWTEDISSEALITELANMLNQYIFSKSKQENT
jgi:AcrR family transcriptional regulator